MTPLFDANSLMMFVTNTGSFAYDKTVLLGKSDGLYFPKGTNKTVIYAAGFWMGGKVGGGVRTAAAEYSNPHGVLEYLHDFSTLVGMRPVLLDGFPYLGVGAHGDPEEDDVFRPRERAKELGGALARAAAARGRDRRA